MKVHGDVLFDLWVSNDVHAGLLEIIPDDPRSRQIRTESKLANDTKFVRIEGSGNIPRGKVAKNELD